MKASVSCCSRSRRAECSAAPSAKSSAVCTPPAEMIATPTASIRREINPHSLQKRNALGLFMSACLPASCGDGLLDSRRLEKLAVVVVLAIVGRHEPQFAGALQQLRTRLEYMAAFRILRHVDQRGPDPGQFVGGQFGIGHDAEVLKDLRSPERAILERSEERRVGKEGRERA